MSVKPISDAYRTATPCFIVSYAERAIDFYKAGIRCHAVEIRCAQPRLRAASRSLHGIGGGTHGICGGHLSRRFASTAAMVNHCYCYWLDDDFGPLKFCSYFPYNAKLCINGHEYAKRRLRKRGVGFEALDKVELAIKCSDGNTRQATSAYP